MSASDRCLTPLARLIQRKPPVSLLIALAILMMIPAGAFAQTGELPNAPDAVQVQLAMNAGFSSSTASDDSAPQQSNSPASAAAGDKTICGINHIGRCIKDLGEDDKGIFTSPARLQSKDGAWLVPLAGSAFMAFSYDQKAEDKLGPTPSYADKASTISNIGSFYASGAEGAAIYFAGVARHNPKLAETGRLGAEAVIDSGTLVLLTKLVSNRQRPSEGDGKGHFWPNGKSNYEWDGSFPSDHAAASMALARVVAAEYPQWYMQAGAYGFAETVSILRILGKQHFPSDVVVGQAIGFLTANYVLNHRALYRPGKKNLTKSLLQSVLPIANAETRTYAVAMSFPMGH